MSHRLSLGHLRAFFSAAIFMLLLPGCSTIPEETGVDHEQRIDNVPMYGQPEIPRPEFLKEADANFIRDAARKYDGDREVASDAWAKKADRYIAQGELHYAMRRYNQAWLLDPGNYLAYWGFGRILLERDDLDGAVENFDTALRLVDNDYEKVALLSDAGVAYSHAGYRAGLETPDQGASYFAKANQYFEQSTTMDPAYPNSWSRWAMSLHREGDYERAWEKVERAQSLDARPFPYGFLDDLKARLEKSE